MEPDMLLQLISTTLTILMLLGGFFVSIYNSNKNRIIADQKHKQESNEMKRSMDNLRKEVTETNSRLESKVDEISKKVEEHSHFEAKISNLDGRLCGLEQLVGILHPGTSFKDQKR